GRYRALYSPAWSAASELVAAWLKEAGLLVRRDAVGNVWGRVEGSRGGRAIVTGSHIDTVRGGGALDGALGVVAAVEAVASLVASYGRPTRILECVAICEEEGSRFNTNLWGARARRPARRVGDGARDRRRRCAHGSSRGRDGRDDRGRTRAGERRARRRALRDRRAPFGSGGAGRPRQRGDERVQGHRSRARP